jgi:pimeloyl-ACP methyl ester carboxylesterase
MNSYELNGTRLSFEETGAGMLVVFLHPTPLDHDFWRPLTDNLAGVRAILPDLRGHGESELGDDLPTGTFEAASAAPVLNVERMAVDTLALLDHLEIESAVFAGCSVGGYVLLEIWRQAPERVRGMAFICSKAQPDSEANLPRRFAMMEVARTGDTRSLFDEMAVMLIGNTARFRRPEILAEIRSRMIISPEAFIAVQAGLATRPNSLPTIPTIDVPVLAIAGGEDNGVTPEEMQAFQAAPGGCSFHLLIDAGHMAAYEQPEKVASLMADWLRDLGGC